MTPPGFCLRPLTVADEPFLWEMLYQAIYVPDGVPRPPRQVVHEPSLARYVQDWGAPGDMGLVAVKAGTGQPVGATWLRLLTGENRGHGHVDDQTPELSIAVLPEYRGQGLGTALLSHLLAAARGRFPAVSLSVSRGNPAVALYERLGFEVVSATDRDLTMRQVLDRTDETVGRIGNLAALARGRAEAGSDPRRRSGQPGG